MNQTIVKVAFALLFFSITSYSFGHNEDPKDPKRVTIAVDNLKPGYATITWFDSEITAIQINSSNGYEMPSIPVKDATTLHLNGLIEGSYEIQFLVGSIVVAVENLTVLK